MKKWDGMNWITQQKRLAIYLRDNLHCVYCGKGIEDGAILSLDHLKPRSKGGSHHQTNLITACVDCNTRRGDRTIKLWVGIIAAYTNQTEDKITSTIRRYRARKLKKYTVQAKALISDRGSAKKAIVSL